MVLATTISCLVVALLSVCTATPIDATLEGRNTKSRNPTALYFLVNNDTANAIRAIPVQNDGTLTDKGVTTTLTGGRGSSVINVFTGKVAGQDALSTANSLIREGNVRHLPITLSSETSFADELGTSICSPSMLVPIQSQCLRWIPITQRACLWLVTL